jgi:hypothetical protein
VSDDHVEVTSAEIARLAGVGPAAVSNWRRRHDDFPQPVGGTDRSPRFRLGEVQAWLAAHGRDLDVGPDLRLWHAMDAVRDGITIADATTVVGSLLFHLRSHPDTPAPGDDDGWSALLADAARVAPQPLPVVDIAQVRPLLEATYAVASGPSAADAFEGLVPHVLASEAGTGFFSTPPLLADLMVDLAGEPTDGALLDPACGSGTILLAAAARGHAHLRGRDRDGVLLALAAQRTALRSLDGDHHGSVRLSAGDSLLRPAPADEPAGAVVTIPPLAERNWGYDELVDDPRWEYGPPARSEPELAWVQHALSQVRPDGAVVILMPPGAGFRPSGRRIRRNLVTSGALRAVVSLPGGITTYTPVPLQVWVLRRPGAAPPPEHLLMVNTTGHAPATRGGTAAAWRQIHALVTEVWQAYGKDPAGFVERPGTARAVPVPDLLDEDVDVTPRRHLPVPAPAAPVDVDGDRRRLLRLLKELADDLPTVDDPLPPIDDGVRVVSVSDLAATGAVFLRRPARPDPEAGEVVTARVLTGEDVSRGLPASASKEVDSDEVRNPPIRAGDVLVPAITRTVVARVATGEDAGAYPTRSVLVVRTDPQVLDPWFLAGYLSSGEGGRQAERFSTSLGGHVRVELRRVRLPLPPIEVQRRYGEAFRRLDEFRRNLRAAHDLGQQLTRDLAHLVAAALATDTPTTRTRTEGTR